MKNSPAQHPPTQGQLPQHLPAQSPPSQHPPAPHSPTKQAVVLTMLLWPACVAGATLGALVGMMTGALGDNSGGWVALGWALLGMMIGTAVGAGLLGWIWAQVCGRRRWLPTLALLIMLGIGGTSMLILLSRVSESDQDALRIVEIVAIVIVVTALTFVIGKRTPLRPPPRATATKAAALQ